MAHIKTYARLKPTRKPFAGYSTSKNRLTIPIPDNKDHLMNPNSLPSHSSVTYDILFDNIFLPEANQEDIFEDVAKNIIQNFLTGYNGTIFVYGQTGTGKTYTMEGNACRYQTRGLGTRALAMIYQELEKRKDEHISVYLSFLEIYQEVAYDLLNPASSTMLPVVPFAKVTVVEGPSGGCILRGLSLHLAANEDVAQMLLLQGQANRKIAETPVNQRSSRSHAVFSVYLQARKKDSQVILSSKLHLVDLAGSERVSKTGVDGQQLSEAKSINLSLHHLETVIIFLQDEQQQKAPKGEASSYIRCSNSYISNDSNSLKLPRRHIPYRNSLLTMILKDSLGGNCLTAMIATISLDTENLGESISTCRFAQRVARVANFARRNEEIDDKMLIKKLKLRVKHLESQVSLLLARSDVESCTQETGDSESTGQEVVNCSEVIDDFLHGVIHDPVSAGISNHVRFRQCLQLMKSRMLENGIISTDTVKSELQSKSKPLNHLFPNDEEILMESSDTGFSLLESTFQDESTSLPKTAPIEVTKSQPKSNTSLPKQQYDVKPGRKEIASLPVERKMDDIELLLSGASPSNNSYKSPFERKREKEIKKLGKKLFSIEEEKAAQKEELELMKQDTVLNSLRMEEDGMSLKLQVADEQIADQHAYILHLKHMECDPDLMAQEVLVEKQLQKRQMNFKSKLDDIRERRTGVERELSKMAQDKGKNRNETKAVKSVEDRYGQYKQNKGSLNTRQVYEMLKSEEKKQKKEVGKVEREKTLMKTKQLELKEMATWEKLRELKQMLKMSQRQDQDMQLAMAMDAQFIDPEHNAHNNKVGPSHFESQTSAKASEELVSPEDFLSANAVSPDKSRRKISLPPSQLLKESVQYGHDSMGDRYEGDNVRMYQNKCSSSDRSEQSWADYLSHEDQVISPRSIKANASGNHLEAGSLAPRPSEKFSDPEKSKQNVSNGLALTANHTSDENEQNESFVRRDKNNNSKPSQGNYLQNLKLDFTDLETNEDRGQGVISAMSTPTSVHSSFSVKNSDVNFNEKDNSLMMEDIMQSLSPSTVQYNSNRSEDMDYPRNRTNSHKVLPPSEYINSMTEKEQFDARRMGLSSRTFESALSHMLDESNNTGNTNAPDLPYSVDVYDKYARKSTSSHQHQPQKQHRSHQKKLFSHSSTNSTNKHRTTNGIERKKVMEERSVWGPDVKNISIADRLSGLFDETPDDFLPSQNKNKMQTSSKHLMENRDQGDTFNLGSLGLEPESSGVVVDDSCDEDDSFFGQQTPRSGVTALKKEDGEKTFMTRVASERERIAKIRKARYAAEVIQKHWRKFKTK